MGEEIRKHPTASIQEMLERAVANLPPDVGSVVVDACYDTEEKKLVSGAMFRLKTGWSLGMWIEKPNHKGLAFGVTSVWTPGR